ncbi:hypothetical protein [Candidatus Chlamydia sanziniae]|uniref:Uncharacterized protein n=1 Tax=Candidatus Chlamydia sanziniae TaxID=1806891 RepID=A0A1A9HXH7_9CHLA|nr:hypothetical protein [Candidatus Chlamydia sanziniae]ANH78792.1 hypothetical protein Cs308_0622 [Candidatus Chlamydia sanziniae]
MRVIFPDKHNKLPFLRRVLKQLPFLIFVTSCSAPFIAYMMNKFFCIPGVLETLALSVKGIQKHYFWQFITYPLITADSLSLHQEQSWEITQRLLIRNTLDFLFFYKATNHVMRKLGAFSLLTLIVGQILIIGTVLWGLMKLFHSTQVFFGPESLICALVLVHVFLDAEKRIQLGPTPLTFAKKWGFLLILGFYFCILIFSGAYFIFLATILSLVLSIFFCKKEKIPNPYITSL